jgi:hypothetical protein
MQGHRSGEVTSPRWAGFVVQVVELLNALLHEADGMLGRLRFNEQMKVLGNLC